MNQDNMYRLRNMAYEVLADPNTARPQYMATAIIALLDQLDQTIRQLNELNEFMDGL